MLTCLLSNTSGYRVYEYLLEGVMPERLTTSQRQYLTQRAKPFVLQEGVLYTFGQDNKFCQVL
jgi:hypothetical protein